MLIRHSVPTLYSIPGWAYSWWPALASYPIHTSTDPGLSHELRLGPHSIHALAHPSIPFLMSFPPFTFCHIFKYQTYPPSSVFLHSTRTHSCTWSSYSWLSSQSHVCFTNKHAYIIIDTISFIAHIISFCPNLFWSPHQHNLLLVLPDAGTTAFWPLLCTAGCAVGFGN